MARRSTKDTASDGTSLLADLIRQTAGGDASAFKALYDLTYSRLLRICMRTTGNVSDAEDALADAYLKIWRMAHMWDAGKGSPIGWMSVIARNRAIDKFRLVKHHSPLSPGLADIQDEAPDSSEKIIVAQRIGEMLASIEDLKPDIRDAIHGFFFEDQSYIEMSTRTGVSQNTMKSRVRRAIAQIRSDLKDK